MAPGRADDRQRARAGGTEVVHDGRMRHDPILGAERRLRWRGSLGGMMIRDKSLLYVLLLALGVFLATSGHTQSL